MTLPVVPSGASADQVREALKESAQSMIELRSKPIDQLTPELRTELREHTEFINNLDTSLTGLERSEVPPTPQPESSGPTAAGVVPTTRARTFAGQVVEDEKYKDFARAGRASDSAVEIQIEGSMFSRALISEGTFTDGQGSEAALFIPQGTPQFNPAPRQRKLFIRDLLSVTQTGLATVPYIQETNPATYETGATAVAEGGLKPEVEMHWNRQDAPIRKIAAWIPVTTEIIEDAPTLRGYIDQRLLYMIALREEVQILNGPGTTVNMKGIRQQTGLQTQAAVTGDLPAGVGLSIAKVENVDGEADGAAVNPLDYWGAAVSRHSTQFDNGFGGNAPAVMSGITWGLPVVRTRAMETGKYLVGAFQLGATLLDRQAAVIRVGNQHSDYFIYNKVVVLGEERVGLAVHRPDFFVEGTYTAA